MMVKLKECYYQAKQDNDQRRSIVQQMLQKGTDFLRRIISPAEGQAGVTLCALIATDTRVKITSGGSRRGTG